jgi:hypothetical protein
LYLKGGKINARKFFLRHGFFTRRPQKEALYFQRFKFGLSRALCKIEGGRHAEDPFRGLRAGPARSSPSLLPHHTPKPHPTNYTHRRELVRVSVRQFSLSGFEFLKMARTICRADPFKT